MPVLATFCELPKYGFAWVIALIAYMLAVSINTLRVAVPRCRNTTGTQSTHFKQASADFSMYRMYAVIQKATRRNSTLERRELDMNKFSDAFSISK